ncbi:MAG: penicillin-binding protein activator [Alphaproteobacteria bacterium]
MKLVSLLFAFFCIFALAGCSSGGSAPSQAGNIDAILSPSDLPAEPIHEMPPVKVGLLLPLSGENAALGNAMLKSAQMALFDMGTANFELVPRDTAHGAGEAAQDAIRQGASLILGPVFAADVRAAKEVTQAAGVNMIAFSTDWTLTSDNTFIMGFLPFDQMGRITHYAAGKNIKNIGVIVPAGDYGNIVATAFQNAAAQRGVSVTATQRFAATPGAAKQAAEQFVKTAAGAQGVLIPAGGTQAIAIAQALSQNGAKLQRLGTGLFDDPALAASGALEGAWFAGPAPALRVTFENRFREAYGAAPPRLATLSYDATALAAILAQRGYETGDKPAYDRDSITNPNGFSGVDGIFRFRPDGRAERGLAVLEFRQGRIEVLDPAPLTFQAPSF